MMYNSCPSSPSSHFKVGHDCRCVPRRRCVVRVGEDALVVPALVNRPRSAPRAKRENRSALLMPTLRIGLRAAVVSLPEPGSSISPADASAKPALNIGSCGSCCLCPFPAMTTPVPQPHHLPILTPPAPRRCRWCEPLGAGGRYQANMLPCPDAVAPPGSFRHCSVSPLGTLRHSCSRRPSPSAPSTGRSGTADPSTSPMDLRHAQL